MKTQAINHWKIKMLADSLGSFWDAIALFELLIHFASNFAPDDGCISRAGLGALSAWLGKGQEATKHYVEQLLACRLLDDRDGQLWLHDWCEHRPDYLRERARKQAERSAKYPPSVEICPGQSRTVLDNTGKSGPTQPNPTQPKETSASALLADLQSADRPNEADQKDKPPKPPTKPKPNNRTAAFQRWYAAYPRHVKPEKAAAAFQRAIERIAFEIDGDKAGAFEWLMQRTEAFAKSPAGHAAQFVPYPASWLNGGQYHDDPAEWEREREDGEPTPKSRIVKPDSNPIQQPAPDALRQAMRQGATQRRAECPGREKTP